MVNQISQAKVWFGERYLKIGFASRFLCRSPKLQQKERPEDAEVCAPKP